MKRSTKKRFARFMALALSLILMMGLAACGGGSDTGSGEQTGQDSSSGAVKTTLNYGLTGDPASLDPCMTTDQMSRAVWTQMYETCARLMPDGTWQPRVAESWSISDDGMKVTLNIRKGVLFHDGTELTAEDVAFSLNRLCESPTTSGMMTSMEPGCSVATDDYTVEVSLTAPFGAILNVIFVEGRIVSKKAVEEKGDEGFAISPVGCGPYKFVERSTGEKIVLTKFEDHFMDDPQITDITFKIITDSSTAALALETGDLDFLSHAPLASKESLMNNPDLTWYEVPICGNVYVQFNVETGAFANKTLRQAVQYGINKEDLLLGGVEGYGETITTMIPSECQGYPGEIEDVPYDLERAKELLAEAGYEPGELTVVLKTQENATFSKPTYVLQGQLQAMGINAEVEMMERAVFFAEKRAANYECLIAHWTAPTMDADFLWQMMHSSELGAANGSRINDPNLDEQLEIGRYSMDQEIRTEAYKKASEIIRDEVYFIPLYTFASPCAADKNLQGVIPDSLHKYYVTDWHW